ncbi:FAD-dependent oxidoreductase [Loktanella sp. D2R18]|uniref:NAD(P)/FAD-dependent oxidoreductase n=1 Tax=Rhodobacterales TaxID=204455 RepID=UPI000DEA5042|nr:MULTISPECIES: FAD-binding oxidoreductase [Rhodobacterales]MDO6592095.1 FAD-binding oxidoreductase [Yoonia sp. 1_MG-2023]RBW43096.1 FAD-dependent oxidoreductase [Loktanella sp. D2R18]
MATADVTVMGAGVFGLSVAYACAQRGARVKVIDPNGVAAGSSGGVVGALAPHVPENWNEKKAFQFDSLIYAERFWNEVSALTAADVGYARSGRLQPLADARAVELAQDRAVTGSELWEGKALWEVIATPDSTWMPQSPSGFIVRDTLSALVHPRRATRALADAVIALGGTVATSGDAVGQIVWATGHAGVMELGGGGVKGQAALLAFDAKHQPQLFADALHIIPHCDGTVAIGSTTERDFDNPSTTDDQLEDVLSRARVAFPVLRDAPVIERWAGVRPRSRNRAPILGHHPNRPGEFVANGGFKIGFGMAPKVGQVMADLVLDGQNVIPVDFRP